MRSTTLAISALALFALGLTSAQAADNTVPGGTGIEQSTEGQGATNKDTETNTPMGAAGGPSTGLEPGTGVEDSVQGEGATAKQGKPDDEEGKTGMNTGTSTSTAPGGQGVEKSVEGEGAMQKN
jgi:hypothetical protein